MSIVRRPGPEGVVVIATGVAALLAFAMQPCLAQSTRGDTVPGSASLAGVIRDSVGRPIVLATVRVEGTGLFTTSDDSGRFHLPGIRSGLNVFMVRRVGFDSVSFARAMPPNTTIVIEIRLRPNTILEPVVVTGDRETRLARSGFYERRRLGLGSFVTPERVDSLSHVSRPSQLLRDVRGIDLRCGASGCRVVSRWADCLWLFVDGVAHGSDQIDDVLTTGAVYAIEVYDRPARTPLQFQGRLPVKSGGLTSSAGCGALVVWTVSRAP